MGHRWRRRKRRMGAPSLDCPYGTCDHLKMEHQGTECLAILDDGTRCPCPIRQVQR